MRLTAIILITLFFTSCDIIRALPKESAAYRKKMVEAHTDDIAKCFKKDSRFEFFVTGIFTNKNWGFMTGSGVGYIKNPKEDLTYFTEGRTFTTEEKNCVGKSFSKIEFPIIDTRVTHEAVSFKLELLNNKIFVRYASNFSEDELSKEK